MFKLVLHDVPIMPAYSMLRVLVRDKTFFLSMHHTRNSLPLVESHWPQILSFIKHHMFSFLFGQKNGVANLPCRSVGKKRHK